MRSIRFAVASILSNILEWSIISFCFCRISRNDSRPLRGYDESSDGILWESPSPTSPGTNYQSVDMPTCPKFIQNGDNKTKRKYLPCQAVPVFVKAEVDTGRVEQQCAFSYDQMQLISNVEIYKRHIYLHVCFTIS